ncbi:MAG: hypothetical protein JKY61_04815 [Planctomycetes bacterium]|nr:hypothetical protein [Planctomycetota bacterium]
MLFGHSDTRSRPDSPAPWPGILIVANQLTQMAIESFSFAPLSSTQGITHPLWMQGSEPWEKTLPIPEDGQL